MNIENNNKDVVYNNNRFKILNNNGFKDFVGVTKTTGRHETLIIYIGKKSFIKITPEHKVFFSETKSKEAYKYNVGDHIFTNRGLKKIIKIEKSYSDNVYDILHVHDKYHNIYIETPDGEILTSNCLYIDEMGFLPNPEEFYESVYPTISSSDTTKCIITSTPKGLNFFYKLWVDAESGRNAYIPYDVKWFEHPDRDEKWYENERKNLSTSSLEQEVNCVSGDTLVGIDGIDIRIGDLYSKYNVLRAM